MSGRLDLRGESLFSRHCSALICRLILLAIIITAPLGLLADEPKPLTFFGDKDYPPIAFLENGTAKGMDVDLATALAGPMNRTVRIELTDWSLAQEKVLNGEGDALLGMCITEERRKRFDFASPTFIREFSLLVRAGDVT